MVLIMTEVRATDLKLVGGGTLLLMMGLTVVSTAGFQLLSTAMSPGPGELPLWPPSGLLAALLW